MLASYIQQCFDVHLLTLQNPPKKLSTKKE